MKTCPKCKLQIPENVPPVRYCWRCGANLQAPKHSPYLRAIVTLASLGLVIWALTRSDNAPAKATAAPKSEPAFAPGTAPCYPVMLDWKPGGDGFVSGHIKNMGTSGCSYVEVRFSVYDHAGKALQEHIRANIGELALNDVWEFKAYYTGRRYDSGGVRSVRYDRIESY
jgi:hypothetical protein